MNRRLSLLLLAAALLCTPPLRGFANQPPPPAGGEAGEAAKPESKIIQLPPLYVPVLDGRRVVKYAIVGITLEAAPAVATGAIKRVLPRLNDALLIEAYRYAKANESLDIEALRAQLTVAIENILGPGQIAGLYFAGLRERSI